MLFSNFVGSLYFQTIQPPRGSMAAFFLYNLILQTRSHPVGLDVWFLVGPFVYFHTSCVRTAKALARRRLAWAFAVRLCDKYHNLMSRLICFVFLFFFVFCFVFCCCFFIWPITGVTFNKTFFHLRENFRLWHVLDFYYIHKPTSDSSEIRFASLLLNHLNVLLFCKCLRTSLLKLTLRCCCFSFSREVFGKGFIILEAPRWIKHSDVVRFSYGFEHRF